MKLRRIKKAIKSLVTAGSIRSEHAYASRGSTVKVISNDGGIPAGGLDLLIDVAKENPR